MILTLQPLNLSLCFLPLMCAQNTARVSRKLQCSVDLKIPSKLRQTSLASQANCHTTFIALPPSSSRRLGAMPHSNEAAGGA